MRSKLIFIPFVALLAAAPACGGGTAEPAATQTSGPKALFTDDFSDTSSGWGADTGEHSSRDYSNGEYVLTVNTDKYFVWDNPGERSFSNAHVEVTVRDTEKARDATFGIICNYQDEKHFYYLGIGSDGYYAIVEAEGEDDRVLTDADNKWIQSDKIAQNKSSYRVGADCGQGQLTLYVDGEQIDSVGDETLTEGNVGLFVLTFDQPEVEVHFDDLSVTALK